VSGILKFPDFQWP